MKRTNVSLGGLGSRTCGAHGMLAALVSCLVAGAAAQAAVPASPIGTTWDCVVSGGGQQGIALINFADDFTFSGYQLLTSTVRKQSSDDGRNPGGDVGRNGGTSTTNSLTAQTNLFGFGRISGRWSFDYRGRVIGNLTQLLESQAGSDEPLTNGVSFTASVVPGKRLTLVEFTPHGKVAFRGISYRTTTPDISGAWYGTRKKGQQLFTEFFTLTPVGADNPFPAEFGDIGSFPGIYFTADGDGPAYSFLGFSMLSSQKKIGFTFASSPAGSTNSVLSSTIGSFSSKRVNRASTKGIEEPFTPVSFNAVMQAPAVAPQ